MPYKRTTLSTTSARIDLSLVASPPLIAMSSVESSISVTPTNVDEVEVKFMAVDDADAGANSSGADLEYTLYWSVKEEGTGEHT